MKKILILASNPRKDLNLDREIRDLKDVIERSRNRAELKVEVGLAVRVGDLQDLLFHHQPNIVHFCGHGSGAEGLVFEGNEGEEQWLRADALSGLFQFLPDVNCVLLNACYSEEQADAIVNHIDYVIGMRQTIRDDAAIAFSKGFYRALGYEYSIEQSYGVGCNAIQLEISGSSKRKSPERSTVSEQERKLEVVEAGAIAIPEHQKPVLKKKATLGGDSGFIPVEAQVALQVEVSKALEEEDSSLREYREQVQEYLSDRQLEPFEKLLLDHLRDELGLSVEETEAIIQQELAPIQEAQKTYVKRLSGLIAAGHDPKDQRIQAEMKKFQARKNLTDAEVEQISQPILVAEAARQEAMRQKQIKQQEAAEQEQQRQIEATQQAETDRLRREAAEREKLEQAQRQAEADRLRREAEERQRQEQAEAKRRQEEEKHSPQMRSFEFQIATIEIESAGLFGGKKTKKINQRRGQAEYFTEALNNTVTLEMVSIPGGTFTMGSPNSELERTSRESPQHQVTIAPFHIGRYAITQAQWKAIAALPQLDRPLEADPSNFKGNDRPVEQVSWDDAIEFCARLSGETGRKYRLPSEAQWEYACRAGTTTPFYFGETIATDLANYRGTDWEYNGKVYPGNYGRGEKGIYREKTTPVGSFAIANAFGLYDMHGNVWEWCADDWHENYQGAPTDGSVWLEGGDRTYRLLRGGSWGNDPRYCRSANRVRYTPDIRYTYIGFRVICVSART